MAAIDDKFHIKIDGYGFMLAKQARIERHFYGREEAPSFVNKFGSGDPNYRDSTFFPHWVQNNWLNGFDQEKFNDGGKFFRSSKIDPTKQEELTLQKAIDSLGTVSNAPKSFGIRTASSASRWWDSNYAYRQQLTVTAPTATALTEGYPVKITIDTAALQTATKLLANRNDWRVIYDNGTTLVDLSRDYVSASVTFFAVQAAIAAAQTDSNYYVYYGYSGASDNKQPTTEATWNAVYGMYGVTPDANTKAVYHFREGSGTAVNDDSAQTNNGTASGSPTWGTDGKFGRYMNFDRTDDYINIGSNSDLNLGSMTIEGWIYNNDQNNFQHVISRESTIGGNNAYRVWFDPGSGFLKFEVQQADGTLITCSYGLPNITNNTWHHYAFTFDGSTTSKIWFNGVNVASANPNSIVASTGDANIGTDYAETTGAGNAFFYGRMHHLRISNTARTSFPYVHAAEPVVTTAGETLLASAVSSGLFEVYAGDSSGAVYLWDGATTWTEVFNIRRLKWFDTIASGDTDYYIGDQAGTERAQSQSFQLDAASKIKAVQVYIKKANGTPSDLQVRIETNNAGVPSGTLADANLLKTVAVADIPASFGWITVEFASPSSAVLASGTTFHIVLKTAAAANDQNYNWKADASSPSYSGGARSHSADGGSAWTADSAADFLFRILAETSQINQMVQATFSGTTKLWLATGDPTNTGNNNARVYTYDGTTWVLNKTFTGAGSSAALCLQVYGLTTAKLYVGLCPTARVESTSDGSTWAASKDIDEPDNPGFVWDMEVYNGRLYACGGHPEYVISNNSQGFLWSFDDFSWNFVYDFSFTVVKSLAVFDSLLFLGTVNKRLYVYNTASMDKLLEFPWEVSINQMEVFDDKLALGLGATNALTGEEAVYLFDRNGFHNAYVPTSVGINCLAVARNQLIIGTTSTTIYRVSTNNYTPTGYVQTSYFEAALPSVDKKWRSLIVHYEELPAGCSIVLDYKTDESNASWTNIGTADDIGTLLEEFNFAVDFYSKKLSIRITLTTSNPTVAPVLKIMDIRYVLMPDFKYLWKMKLVCPDNIIWLDGTQPISTTAETIDLAETSLDLVDASGFPTKGRAVVVDGSTEDEFTWTGKSSNTLTGCVGLTAHSSSGLVVKMTGATMHKTILTLKQTKSLFTFYDIDNISYTALFHQYQADDFVVNQTDGLENNVPITLLEA